jgi:glutamyl-tRNA synthetase
MEQGLPDDAVEYYLRGLANGRLAEMPLNEALRTPIRLDLFGVAGPLVDLVKLDDISADYVSTLTGEQILVLLREWAATYDPELVDILDAERDLALRALAIERGSEVPNPRKDLRKWSDFRAVYGYFFPQIFEPVADPADPRFSGVAPDLVRAIAADFADNYRPPQPDAEWFDQIRELTERLGFAPSQKVYKAEPGKYPGSLKDTSHVIRVLLTGSGRSPNLPEVTGALGEAEVLRRVRAVLSAG